MTPDQIDPHSVNFFILLLLGGAVFYGLVPAAGAGFLILAALWMLASYPLIAIMFALLWVLKTPLRWLAEGLIFGWAGGLGARLSGVFSSPERAERERERYEDRRGRR